MGRVRELVANVSALHFCGIILCLFIIAGCRDNDRRCPYWIKYCSFHQFVQANCKKTCKRCWKQGIKLESKNNRWTKGVAQKSNYLPQFISFPPAHCFYNPFSLWQVKHCSSSFFKITMIWNKLISNLSLYLVGCKGLFHCFTRKLLNWIL